MGLFRGQVPDGALTAVAAAPARARREALRATLVAHRPQLEAFFQARSARFIPALLGLWDRPAPPVNFLDIGCGSGARTHAIARAFGVPPRQVRGCDIEMRWGPERPGLFVFDGRRLDACADESCDLMSLSMVLHHVEAPELILQEIRRVLRPGGRLILREHDCIDGRFERLLDEFHWFMRNAFHDAMPTVQYRSRAAWRALLADAGLRHLRGSAPEAMAAEDPVLRSYADLFAAK